MKRMFSIFRAFNIFQRLMFLKFYDGEGGGGGDGEGDGGSGNSDDGDGSGGDGSGDGDGDKPWQETLPKDVQEWNETKEAKDPEAFWKVMANLKSFRGRDAIRIPSKEASEADVAAFHKKIMEKVPGLSKSVDKNDPEAMAALYKTLGAPEKADDYKVDIGEKNKDNNLDLSLIEVFRPLAQANGISQKQFNNIVNGIVDANLEKSATAAGMLKANSDSLKEEWGGAYKQNVDMVTVLTDTFDAPDMIKAAIKDGVMDQGSMQMFHKMAVAMGSEGAGIIDDKANRGALSPADAKDQIADIMSNKDHPYWNSQMPGHLDAKKKMRKLRLAETGETEKGGREAIKRASIV